MWFVKILISNFDIFDINIGIIIFFEVTGINKFGFKLNQPDPIEFD